MILTYSGPRHLTAGCINPRRPRTTKSSGLNPSKAHRRPDEASTHKWDLSPIAAECGSISACSTQNKAKRANKIVFLLLIPDQEVDGSNPFARPLLLGVRPELTTYNRRRSGRPLGARPRRSAVQFDSASDSSTQKACPDLSTNRSLAVQGQRSNKARQRRITDYWRYKWTGNPR